VLAQAAGWLVFDVDLDRVIFCNEGYFFR